MRYQQFPDEETCHALSEMKAYYAAIGTTPIQVFKNIDVANKGALTYWDFYKGFKNKGFKFEQKVAEKLMALLDREGAGTVRPWLYTTTLSFENMLEGVVKATEEIASKS